MTIRHERDNLLRNKVLHLQGMKANEYIYIYIINCVLHLQGNKVLHLHYREEKET